MKRKTDTRDRILDATLDITSTCGACRVTIDAVSERSGVSKGGVLYHFPDKAALLSGLLDRHLSRQAEIFRAAEAEHGPSTQGRLHAAISVTAQRTNAQAVLPLLGILALEPRLLKRPRRMGAQFLATLRKDRRRFIRAMIVVLANSGLSLSEVLGTVTLTAAERRDVIAALHQLADDL